MKKIFISLITLLTILSFSQSVFAADNVLNTVCNNANSYQSGSRPTVCNDTAPSSNPVYGILKSVLNILSYAIGAISVIVIIIAGLRLVLSGGDPQTLTSARNAIIYAAIGIVVFALAQSIVVFALKNV
jgi:hypothetical protein